MRGGFRSGGWGALGGLRPLDIGVDSAKGFRGDMRSSLRGDEIRTVAEGLLSFASFVL